MTTSAPPGALLLLLPPVVAGAYVPRLRRQVTAALREGREVLLDCGDVQELSPAAQALLVAGSRLARLHGGRLQLRRPSPAVVRALRSTGLTHLLARPSAG